MPRTLLYRAPGAVIADLTTANPGELLSVQTPTSTIHSRPFGPSVAGSPAEGRCFAIRNSASSAQRGIVLWDFDIAGISGPAKIQDGGFGFWVRAWPGTEVDGNSQIIRIENQTHNTAAFVEINPQTLELSCQTYDQFEPGRRRRLENVYSLNAGEWTWIAAEWSGGAFSKRFRFLGMRLPESQPELFAEFDQGIRFLDNPSRLALGYGLSSSSTLSSRQRFLFGCPSLYEIDAVGDMDSYDTDIIRPVVRPAQTWYVSQSGLPENDGLSVASPITFDRARGDGLDVIESGDIVEVESATIDSIAVYENGSARISTEGVTWRPHAGQEHWELNVWDDYRNDPSWIQPDIANAPNVYSIANPNAGGVIWESPCAEGSDGTFKWLIRSSGDTFADVRDGLQNNPGSHWYDDAGTLYLHPLGSTDPRSDNKTYRASRTQSKSGLTTNRGTVIGCRTGYVYVLNRFRVQTVHYVLTVLEHSDVVLKDCYATHGANHLFGAIGQPTGGSLLVEDCQFEQGTPYEPQTTIVSFDQGAGTNRKHTYRRVTINAAVGVIHSSIGSSDSDAFFYHIGNAVADRNFDALRFESCNFGGRLRAADTASYQGLVIDNSRVRGEVDGIGIISGNTIIDGDLNGLNWHVQSSTEIKGDTNASVSEFVDDTEILAIQIVDRIERAGGSLDLLNISLDSVARPEDVQLTVNPTQLDPATRVKLDADQPDYAPAKPGDPMTAVNIGSGVVVGSQPVSTNGKIASPIVIGDDYLAENSRGFSWLIDPIPGIDINQARCFFGGSFRHGGGWNVEGSVSPADLNGSAKWEMSFDLKTDNTYGLEPANYDWSVELRGPNDENLTKILGEVELVRAFTNA